MTNVKNEKWLMNLKQGDTVCVTNIFRSQNIKTYTPTRLCDICKVEGILENGNIVVNGMIFSPNGGVIFPRGISNIDLNLLEIVEPTKSLERIVMIMEFSDKIRKVNWNHIPIDIIQNIDNMMKYYDEWRVMIVQNDNLKVGDILYIYEGMDDRLISRDAYGKIILVSNWKDLHKGYAKVDRIRKNAEKYYRVKMTNIAHDIYPTISSDELMQVCEKYNYKLGYTLPVNHPSVKYIQYLFYNMENGNILVCNKSDNVSDNNQTKWLSFNLNISVPSSINSNYKYFEFGSENQTSLNLTMFGITFPPGFLEQGEILSKNKNSCKKWRPESDIILYRYEEIRDCHSFKEIDWVKHNIRKRLLLCPMEIWELLSDVNQLKGIYDEAKLNNNKA